MRILKTRVFTPRNGGTPFLLVSFENPEDVKIILSNKSLLLKDPKVDKLSVKNWLPRDIFLQQRNPSNIISPPFWNYAMGPKYYHRSKFRYPSDFPRFSPLSKIKTSSLN